MLTAKNMRIMDSKYKVTRLIFGLIGVESDRIVKKHCLIFCNQLRRQSKSKMDSQFLITCEKNNLNI
ncbi:hypothetical protein BpHYR1_048350 [Brachionus plicatilis]|uniref:Uncharacterized protein n=1 Tax=Brachionus plicatilis TaxID=10195 RepID=A0A3M7QPK9_BRAPC|nr:hypothetical protein BpHYR1_048350 [Brachionus plicatilis]